MSRYWLNTEKDEAFDIKSEAINEIYQRAPELIEEGEIVISNDEMTGVQALERAAEDKPTLPGKPRLIEYEGLGHRFGQISLEG